MKIALWEESNTNSQINILRMDDTMREQEKLHESEVLTFETENDAIQYLSDLLGKNVKIKGL